MRKYYKEISYFLLIVFIVVLGIAGYNLYHYNFKKKVFGVTYMTMNNPFYKIINNEILKKVEQNGDSLLVLDPELDIEKQNEQILTFVNQKVDGIIINPIDFQGVEPALEAAKRAHIPVIVVDSPINNSELVDCTIVSDNYEAGVLCAEDLIKHYNKANIALLRHTTAKSADERIQGFLDTIKSNENYKIVNEAECKGQLELAMPQMKKMLKETPNIDVVMSLNDPSALGAIAALESSNINNISVYGIDGTPEMKSLLRSNSIVAGTVAQSPINMGKVAISNLYEILDGKAINKNIIIPVLFMNRENINNFSENRWQ